ncbi:MAG: hypothetical protein H0U81_05005 [Pyrinomonadaceae bacterium]|nr:hypothetical protein [Pyrinomonadaceae bacterium]
MNAQNCSCAKFGRLEGASVSAYVAAFLEELESASPSPSGSKRYRCRACGREWEKRAPEVKAAGTRPSLVRLD